MRTTRHHQRQLKRRWTSPINSDTFPSRAVPAIIIGNSSTIASPYNHHHQQQQQNLIIPTSYYALRQQRVFSAPSSSSTTTNYLDDIRLKLKENKIQDAAQVFVSLASEQEADRINDGRKSNEAITEILVKLLPNSPHQAEIFLDELRETHNIYPSIEDYSQILSSWKDCDPPSAKRAQKLLDRMEQQLGIPYRVESCNLVLQTWSSLQNAEGATKLLEEMISRHGKDEEEVINEESFEHVLRAWPNSRSVGSYKKADLLLKKMKHLKFKPTIDCYTSTIQCWSKTKRKDSDQRLQELYRDIVSVIKLNEYSQTAAPEKIQYALLMILKAYSNLNNSHRAEEIVLSYADMYREQKGESIPPPTLEMCLTVLKTWSKSKSSRRGSRAEKFLSLMGKDDALPNPDVTCYTAVINCLTSSDKPKTAQRAELVLRSMISQHQDNDSTSSSSFAPNLLTYTSVMNAWARSKDDDATVHVERLYEEMIHEQNIVPDRRVFAVLVTAWGRSPRDDSIVHSEKYFQQLQHDTTTMPTVVEYTAIMQAWANYVARNVEKSRIGVACVESLLDEMIEKSKRAEESPDRFIDNDSEKIDTADILRPNSLTFSAVLKTISVARRIPDRRERAKKILKIMNEQGVEITPHMKSIIRECNARI